MKFVSLLLVVLCFQLLQTEAVVFTRCDLAKRLLGFGFSRIDLANWVCLVEQESARNTASIGHPNFDGSRDYGLFQINSVYWCSGAPGSKYNGCGISCSALVNDDIRDDCKCALLIFKQQGFNAWYGWQKRCKGYDVNSYIAGCGV